MNNIFKLNRNKCIIIFSINFDRKKAGHFK